MLPKPHPLSGKKADGDPRLYPPSAITLLGRADMGVSMPSLYALLLPVADGGICWLGGSGRENGLCGPVAPADRMFSPPALRGDGAGRTIPRVGSTADSLIGVVVSVVFKSRVEDSSALPLSDSGMCTFNRGLLASDCMLSVRCGFAKFVASEVDAARTGTWRCMLATIGPALASACLCCPLGSTE